MTPNRNKERNKTKDREIVRRIDWCDGVQGWNNKIKWSQTHAGEKPSKTVCGIHGSILPSRRKPKQSINQRTIVPNGKGKQPKTIEVVKKRNVKGYEPFKKNKEQKNSNPKVRGKKFRV